METAMSLFCVVAFIGLILWLAFGKVKLHKCEHGVSADFQCPKCDAPYDYKSLCGFDRECLCHLNGNNCEKLRAELGKVQAERDALDKAYNNLRAAITQRGIEMYNALRKCCE